MDAHGRGSRLSRRGIVFDRVCTSLGHEGEEEDARGDTARYRRRRRRIARHPVNHGVVRSRFSLVTCHRLLSGGGLPAVRVTTLSISLGACA